MTLHDLQNLMRESLVGAPPGATPLPFKEQVAQFVHDLPDLLARGPRYQQIEAEQGQGAAEEYIRAMLTQIAQGRRRRRPLG